VRDILWKKVQRQELLNDEALLAARLLQGAEIELLPMQPLLEAAVRMSIEIDHATYDCVYLPWLSTTNANLLRQMNAFCGKFIRADRIPLMPGRR
jgi:predicted nucleic acid-binding protein